MPFTEGMLAGALIAAGFGKSSWIILLAGALIAASFGARVTPMGAWSVAV